MNYKILFEQIWAKAKPHYLEGRPMDIVHIEWMMKEVETICKMEVIHSTYDNSDIEIEVWKRGSGVKQNAKKENGPKLSIAPLLKPIPSSRSI